MKGSIFKHFESFVVDHWGADFWEGILEQVSLQTSGPFLGPENYPDEDLLAIVGTTTHALNVPLPEALRLFGRYLFAQLEGDAPELVCEDQSLVEFLQIIDGVIHVEVKKLSPLAQPPRIACEPLPQGGLRMHYRSQRAFCQLFLGLIEGAAERFGSRVSSSQEIACTHRGAEQCTFDFQFQPAA